MSSNLSNFARLFETFSSALIKVPVLAVFKSSASRIGLSFILCPFIVLFSLKSSRINTRSNTAFNCSIIDKSSIKVTHSVPL